jgi:hypothetical protein
MGNYLLWAVFLNYQSRPNVVATFVHGKMCILILINKGLGYILAGFFTNSSGHPDPDFFSLQLRSRLK